MVRDAFGQFLDVENAELVFEVEGGVLARAPIVSTSSKSQNYSIILRLDMEADDTYRSDVLAPGIPVTLYVETNGVRSYPIESNAGLDVSSTVGALIRVDLTLGGDTDGDSIPDGWEWTQLRRAGYGNSDPQFNLATIDQTTDNDNDGTTDFEEYLAGSQAFIAFGVFFSIRSADNDFYQFDLQVREGKRYTIEASADMTSWSANEVYLPHAPDSPQTSWESALSGNVTVRVPRLESFRFYRVMCE